MRAPVLKIRKKVLDVQGHMRPCVQVQAIVDDEVRQILEQDFNETILFKRTLFSNGISDRFPQPEPMLFPLLTNFVKSDTCPEISVRSILSGQLYQAKDPWEVLCFEWIGKRAFDSMVLMMICATEMGTETEYAPCGTDPLSDDAPGDAADTPAEDDENVAPDQTEETITQAA